MSTRVTLILYKVEETLVLLEYIWLFGPWYIDNIFAGAYFTH